MPKPIEYVTILELATTMRMDRSACLKYVKRMGFPIESRRTATSNFQTASVLTRATANAVIAKRKEEGYL